MYIILVEQDIIYLNRFIWNKKKAQGNIKKRHISFEVAARVFLDPVLYVVYDEENSTQEEERYNCIGVIDNQYAVIVVSMTEREPYTRIFSARKATAKERRDYEKNAKNIRGY